MNSFVSVLSTFRGSYRSIEYPHYADNKSWLLSEHWLMISVLAVRIMFQIQPILMLVFILGRLGRMLYIICKRSR